jgi:Ion channel
VIVALPYVALTPIAIVTGLRKHFREEGGVTTQTMFGVLCLYLLVGLLFGVGFAVIEELSNDAFFTTGPAQGDDYLYYSFSTLTTTGYGDLVAATDLGRSLSITEALLGQIYLVTVVALIVSNIRPAASRSPRT